MRMQALSRNGHLCRGDPAPARPHLGPASMTLFPRSDLSLSPGFQRAKGRERPNPELFLKKGLARTALPVWSAMEAVEVIGWSCRYKACKVMAQSLRETWNYLRSDSWS